jgi:hypothetical protein
LTSDQQTIRPSGQSRNWRNGEVNQNLRGGGYNFEDMSEENIQFSLPVDDVKWAIAVSQNSVEKWSERKGYYNNRLNSHLKGKLGELAVEKYLLGKKFKLDSHFRFSERENLCDIVIKVRKYTKIYRLEIKTWSANYWQELGRCIAVDQYPILKKKADFIIWCVVNSTAVAELLKKPQSVLISLVGWSKINEIPNAPIKDTGTGEMRKVKNYQLAEEDIHPILVFTDEGLIA